MSSRPCMRPANCHRHLGTFVRFHRHSKAIIHEYLRAQAYTFNLVQRSCHICLHDLLCARVVAYIRKCIFRYICGYRSALIASKKMCSKQAVTFYLSYESLFIIFLYIAGSVNIMAKCPFFFFSFIVFPLLCGVDVR